MDGNGSRHRDTAADHRGARLAVAADLGADENGFSADAFALAAGCRQEGAEPSDNADAEPYTVANPTSHAEPVSHTDTSARVHFITDADA